MIEGIVLWNTLAERICLLPCFIAWYELWEFTAKDHVEHAKISAVAAIATMPTQHIWGMFLCQRSIQKRYNKRQPTRVQVSFQDGTRKISKLIWCLCTLVYVINGTNAELQTNKQTATRTKSSGQIFNFSHVSFEVSLVHCKRTMENWNEGNSNQWCKLIPNKKNWKSNKERMKKTEKNNDQATLFDSQLKIANWRKNPLSHLFVCLFVHKNFYFMQ